MILITFPSVSFPLWDYFHTHCHAFPFSEASRDPWKDADPREESASPGQAFGTLSQVNHNN